MQEIAPKMVKKGRKMKIMEVEEDDDEQEFEMVNGNPPNGLDDNSVERQEKLAEEVTEVLQKAAGDNLSLGSSNSVKEATDKQSNQDTTKTGQQKNEEKPDKPALDLTNHIKSSDQAQSADAEVPHENAEALPPVEIIHTPLPSELEGVKTEAGKLYRTGQYGAASDKYTLAITRLVSTAEKNPEANYSHALATLYNNRAACKLKSGDDKSCIADCEQVLELKPLDIKALLRRAAAYEHMEKYRLAYDDYRAIQNIDWTVSQAQEGANRVAKHMRDIYGTNWQDTKKEAPPSDLPARSLPARNAESPKPVGSTSKTDKNTRKTKTLQAEKASATQKPNPKVQTPVDSPSVSNKRTSAPNNNASSKSQTAKDERRAKLSQELFVKLKTEGNNFVKKGNYAKAIESYTQCIKICPEEVASYTNRALCFLKLNKDISAVGDCTEAIKLDPKNVKAYYRRAQANTKIKLYREAEKDLNKVLEIEPNNKSAVGELSTVKKLIQASSKRKVPITEVSDDEDDSDSKFQNKKYTEDALRSDKPTAVNVASVTTEAASLDDAQASEHLRTQKIPVANPKKSFTGETKKKAIIKSAQRVSADSSTTQSSPSPVADNASTGSVSLTKGEATNQAKLSKPKNSENVTAERSSTKRSEKTATDVSAFRMQVPENLTPYEFGNLWNSVQPKTNIEAYKCILDNVSSELIPAMVSNKTNDHMIVTFAKIAQIHMLTGTAAEYDRAYGILYQLTKAERFQMAAMFLSKADQALVRSAFAELLNRVKTTPLAFSSANLENLKKAYML